MKNLMKTVYKEKARCIRPGFSRRSTMSFGTGAFWKLILVLLGLIVKRKPRIRITTTKIEID